MKFSTLALLFGFASAEYKQIVIEENGDMKSLFIANPFDKKIESTATSVTLPNHSRIFLTLTD